MTGLSAACVGTEKAGPSVSQPPDAHRTVLYEGGLGPDWKDYGWAPRVLQPGGPAQLNLENYGGWIIASPGLSGSWERLEFDIQATQPEAFLEVKLVDTAGSDLTPVRPSLDPTPQDAWHHVVIPLSKLNPNGAPFDRVVFRAYRAVSAPANVLLDHVALVGPAEAAPSSALPTPKPVTLTIDCSQKKPISPLIYGIAFAGGKEGQDQTIWELGATARRWGGNPTTRYNWTLGDAWNTAQDYYWRNVAVGDGVEPLWRRFLLDNSAHDVASALTVPTIGWVAKDTTSIGFPVSVYGKQERTDPDVPDAGDGVAVGGKALTPGPPGRTSIPAPPGFVADWVRAVDDLPGAKSRQSNGMYILDNEPDLWNSTHRDVHPDPVTYDELWSRTVAYGEAIRSVEPGAVIAGPASWGWPGYQYSALDAVAGFSNKPDRKAHGDVPLIPWYLRQLKTYEQRTGKRLVDVLDVHFYPQADGVYGGGKGATDSATAAKRIRSVRALWDPSYVDESWIGEPVTLLPRLHKWVDDEYPGTRISIGEYSFGAEMDMSGGLAQAEALGRFGQNGVYSAFYWTYPPATSPAYWAFRAYRNFDGKGGHFLNTSVNAMSTSQDVSLFASTDPDTGEIVAVVLNAGRTQPFTAGVTLKNCNAKGPAEIYRYTGGPAGFARDRVVRSNDKDISVNLPPYSISVLRVGGINAP
jgi:hypothetical protein